MKKQIQERLKSLKAEQLKGEKLFNSLTLNIMQLEQEKASLDKQLQQIEGAITLANELLMSVEDSASTHVPMQTDIKLTKLQTTNGKGN